jgi:1-acyl-sn-glycerol-3-phosphate acyltransferase
MAQGKTRKRALPESNGSEVAELRRRASEHSDGDDGSDREVSVSAAARGRQEAARRPRAAGAGKKSARAPRKRAKSAARQKLALRQAEPELPDVQAELESSAEAQRLNKDLVEELIHEMEMLVKRMMRLSPAYRTDLRIPRGLASRALESADQSPEEMGGSLLKKLQKILPADLVDVDTLKGMWAMAKFAGEYQVDVLKRRLKGDYETDEWGMDPEFIDAIRPFFAFLYDKYWRVEMTGLEHIPDDGCALLVSNHSGQLPFDGAMLAMGVLAQHPASRQVRALYANWFPTLPFVSDILVKTGQVLGNDENAQRLLEQNHLVAVFPEGYKGVGKLYKDRYHLARFGRGGFARVALKTRAPLIPVSVIGAEETYISMYKSSTMARLTGFPYFPISPTFPWLGPLGLIPLPTKWSIDIGAPLRTDEYPEGSDNNLVLVSQLTDTTRTIVQKTIYDRLSRRKSIFFG